MLTRCSTNCFLISACRDITAETKTFATLDGTFCCSVKKASNSGSLSCLPKKVLMPSWSTLATSCACVTDLYSLLKLTARPHRSSMARCANFATACAASSPVFDTSTSPALRSIDILPHEERNREATHRRAARIKRFRHQPQRSSGPVLLNNNNKKKLLQAKAQTNEARKRKNAAQALLSRNNVHIYRHCKLALAQEDPQRVVHREDLNLLAVTVALARMLPSSTTERPFRTKTTRSTAKPLLATTKTSSTAHPATKNVSTAQSNSTEQFRKTNSEQQTTDNGHRTTNNERRTSNNEQ